MNDETLLSVGEEEGRVTVSIFDVSDFANPKRVANKILHDSLASTANNNHKAFNYYPELNKLVIPTTLTSTETSFKVFDISSDSITYQKELIHNSCAPRASEPSSESESESLSLTSPAAPAIFAFPDFSARSLFIGETLYPLTKNEIKSVSIFEDLAPKSLLLNQCY